MPGLEIKRAIKEASNARVICKGWYCGLSMDSSFYLFIFGIGIMRVLIMVLKTGPGREPEKGVVPVLVVRPGSDRWSNR